MIAVLAGLLAFHVHVLLDYVDVVVHILQPEAREYYALDQLYAESSQLDWKSVAVPALVDSAARIAK